jgi:uncharacterized protein YjbI with pentapeptide repeats
MREISTEQLEGILSEHQLWLDLGGGGKGKRANLQGVNLRVANLQGADPRLSLTKVDVQIRFLLVAQC